MSDPQLPSRLLHPWDFAGKSTGVGCHCLLHYGHEFKQTLEDGEGQGSLACYCQSRGLQRVGHDLVTEKQLLLIELNLMMPHSSAIIRNYNEQYSCYSKLNEMMRELAELKEVSQMN